MYIEEIRDSKVYEELLHHEGLGSLGTVDYSVGAFEGRNLIAAASLKDDIIMGVAVSDGHKGDGLAAKVIMQILSYAIQKGMQQVYLFTKPEKMIMFTSLGFREIAVARPYACMLEYGLGFDKWLEKLKKYMFSGKPEAAAIVMNGNPFTNGHLYLAETAAAENEYVYLFIVEEDKSIFPFEVRYDLAKHATEHLANVKVIPGGKYIISSLTFPSYFTKEEDVAKAHSSIDLEIFKRHIAPALNIKCRYVGTEPLSPVTNIYNQTMFEILPAAGIDVRQIERKKAEYMSDMPISASYVRMLISEGKLEKIRNLVPTVTFEYINKEFCELKKIINNMGET